MDNEAIIAKIKENGDDNKIAIFPTITIPYNSYIINKYCPIESNTLSRYILSTTILMNNVLLYMKIFYLTTAVSAVIEHTTRIYSFT